MINSIFFSPSGENVILVPLLFRITEFYSQNICYDKQAIHPQVINVSHCLLKSIPKLITFEKKTLRMINLRHSGVHIRGFELGSNSDW